MRVEDGATKRTANGGFLHRLRSDGRVLSMRPRPVTLANPSTRLDLATFAEQRAQEADPDRLARFAHTLGVSLASFRRFRVGWATANELKYVNTACRGPGCWTFPMFDTSCDVLGIRLRTPSGFKYAVKGGKQGLFIPLEIDATNSLVVCEGPTDAAALLDLGFAAIGQPSCTGGVRLVTDFVKACRPARIIVVADNDGPGKRGATALASRVRLYSRDVRTITPPQGLKDARAWLRAGASRDDVLRAIELAPPLQMTVTTRIR